MVAVKGTQTLAPKHHYIGDMHVKEHHHSSYALPLDENRASAPLSEVVYSWTVNAMFVPQRHGHLP